MSENDRQEFQRLNSLENVSLLITSAYEAPNFDIN